MGETPTFLKCCWYVHLRCCLLFWACFKLIADLFFILYLIILPLSWFLHNLDSLSTRKFGLETYIFLGILILLLVDVFWIMFLIVGTCWKKHSCMRAFFFYGIFMIVAEILVMTSLVGWSLYQYYSNRWSPMVIFVVLGIAWVGIDISIMLTLKSEIIKLRNKEIYNFTGEVYNAQPRENYTENDPEYTVKRENEEETHLNPTEIRINKYESFD